MIPLWVYLDKRHWNIRHRVFPPRGSGKMTRLTDTSAWVIRQLYGITKTEPFLKKGSAQSVEKPAMAMTPEQVFWMWTKKQADHIIEVFVVHIAPPGMAVRFCLGTGITCGKNAAAVKNSLADPGRLVGTVCYYGFVFGIVLAQFIVQRVKRCAVMDIAGSDMNIKDEILLVAGSVCFFRQTD